MDPRTGSLYDQARDAANREWQEGQHFEDMHLRGRYTRTCYDYELPDGTLLYQQCRYDPIQSACPPGSDLPKKKFWPRRPLDLAHFDRAGNIGNCVFGAGPRRVIYNWRAILQAGPGALVFVCEGEKNAADLIRLGLLATTVISNHWGDECVAALAGYELMVLEDNDVSGTKQAARAQRALVKVAKSVRVVPLAHLWQHLPPPRNTEQAPPTGDVSDWLEAGGDATQLIDLCRMLPGDGVLNITPYDWPDETSLPMWDFMLGTHLLRGTVSGTAAAGGTGKSSLGIVEILALALASGKTIPGIEPPPRPQRVWLINFEDNRNAMDKRIVAAMKHYGLSPADFGDRLHVAAKRDLVAKLAKQIRNGTVERNEPLIREFVAQIRAKAIDVVSIDPFINAHAVNENDNIAVREVVECFGDIADQATCALHLWHHTRKGNGQGATIDAARGAVAFVDACRCVRVLETMTKDDALKLNILHPGFYFRAFNGKLNFAPPVETSDWYKFENVELNNGGMLFGDNVGVVTRWQRPTTLVVELTPYVIEQIKQKVGPVPRWRVHPAADMWVGIAVAEVLELDPVADVAAIKLVIPKLVKAKALKRVVAQDHTRQERQWYVAGGASAPEEDDGAL